MPNDVLSAALQRLTAGRDLAEDEARDVLLEIMGGRTGEAQTAAFLSALRVKGETAAEIVGMARAMGLALLAEKLPAEKAAEWGLIWAAIDDAEFSTTVDALAKQLSTAPTKALVRTRQAMHAAPTHTLEQQLSMEGSFMRELGWSPDYSEGVAAFMAKRSPNFTGE